MSSRPTSPPSITEIVDREQVRRDVELGLDVVCAGIRATSTAAGPGAARLCDLLEVMLSGGKRLRAAFAYWSWRAHTGRDTDSRRDVAVSIGTALELFQAAALFHDDVIDRSDRRRNHPTAHVVLTADHRSQQWDGDPHHYGLAGAILLGDLALVAASDTLTRSIAGLSATEAAEVARLWQLMAVQVTAGQFLDVQAQAVPWGRDPVADEHRAREVILAKTASYSVELPLAMGAAAAGAGAEQVTAIRAFGRPLGEAFQLRDDVLGVFGDPEQTGKPAGDDVREGKRTVLMARAAAAADAGQLAVLSSSLGRADLSDHEIDAVREIVMSTGALAQIEELIEERYVTALDRLEAAVLTKDGAATLRDLAQATVRRTL